MIAVAVLAVAQAAGSVVPTFARPTPASVTTPEYVVECKMRSAEGSEFQLNFRQTGGRGYLRRAVQEGAEGVGWTPIETVVTLDTTGRYENARLETASVSERGWPGVKRTLAVAEEPFQTQFESAETTTPGRISLEVQPRWPLGDVSASGFCNVRESSQQPLSDAEARELFRS